MESINTLKLHQEHRDWLSELNFVQDEIKYFQYKLAEILAHDPEHNQDEINSFKAILLGFLQEIDELRHSIHTHEYYLSYFKEHKLREGKVIQPSHEDKKLEMTIFHNKYEEFKKNLKSFMGSV